MEEKQHSNDNIHTPHHVIDSDHETEKSKHSIGHTHAHPPSSRLWRLRRTFAPEEYSLPRRDLPPRPSPSKSYLEGL